MDTLHAIPILTAGLLAAAPVLAGHGGQFGGDDGRSFPAYGAPYGQDDYDTAQVLSAEPLMRQVRITIPQRECVAETHYVPVNARDGGGMPPAGQMVLGGLIGAVIGHQIDDRRSGNRGTVAGALIGTAIGHEVARDGLRPNPYGRGDEYRAVDAERCEVHTVERFEERIDGYRVTYRYNSRIYTTQMPRDPGATLRVRVNVAPVG